MISAVDSSSSAYQAGQALVYIVLVVVAVSVISVAVRRRSKQSEKLQPSGDESPEESPSDAWWRQ